MAPSAGRFKQMEDGGDRDTAQQIARMLPFLTDGEVIGALISHNWDLREVIDTMLARTAEERNRETETSPAQAYRQQDSVSSHTSDNRDITSIQVCIKLFSCYHCLMNMPFEWENLAESFG